jgi:nucleoid-associated protein YgaU
MAERGHLSGAIEQLAAAAALGDNSADIHQALGDVYARKGMDAEAARHYSKGLEIAPQRQELIRAQAQLKGARHDSKKSSAGGERRKNGFLIKAGVGALGVALLIAIAVVLQRQNQVAPPEPNINPAAKIEEIRRRLAAHPLLAAHAVSVTQAGDGVRLSGTVPSELHKALAFEVARGVTGEHLNVDLESLSTMPAQPEPDAKPQNFTYTVRRGDTLSNIAFKFYGDRYKWDKVFEANQTRLRAPHDISVGQVLLIPSP